MTCYPARVLCAGNDPEVLHSRCAVLRHAGYEAQAATPPEVEILLRTEEFDLIIEIRTVDRIGEGPHPFCSWRDAYLRAARTDPRWSCFRK